MLGDHLGGVRIHISKRRVIPDHVHVFLSAPPQDSLTAIVDVLKGVTGIHLFKVHPELREKVWGGHIWSPCYFVGTVGHVSSETTQR